MAELLSLREPGKFGKQAGRHARRKGTGGAFHPIGNFLVQRPEALRSRDGVDPSMQPGQQASGSAGDPWARPEALDQQRSRATLQDETPTTFDVEGVEGLRDGDPRAVSRFQGNRLPPAKGLNTRVVELEDSATIQRVDRSSTARRECGNPIVSVIPVAPP